MNKLCSLDLNVAYSVYLDIPNILKLHQWYTIVLRIIIIKYGIKYA